MTTPPEPEFQPRPVRRRPRIKTNRSNDYDRPHRRGRRPERRREETPARLVEWHALPPEQREAVWQQLRDWVTWLHDRYELGLEERLPHCWPLHPGLIEELWALKTWREEIYQQHPARAAPSQSTGQAARYWHAEMRQTITAATGFYAAGCRAGHRGADQRVATDTALQQRWARADPTAGIPESLMSHADEGEFLNTATMTAHRKLGDAVPLSITIEDFVHYDGAWWTSTDGGWYRITDPGLNEKLCRHAAALAQADASVLNRARTRPDGPARSNGTGRDNDGRNA